MPKKIIITKPPMPPGPKMGPSNLDENVVPRKPMSEEPAEPAAPPEPAEDEPNEPPELEAEPGAEATEPET